MQQLNYKIAGAKKCFLFSLPWFQFRLEVKKEKTKSNAGSTVST